MRRFALAWLLLCNPWSCGLALAEDSESKPRPIPLTRPEMKRLLEDLKARQPRIPLPELTEEDRRLLGNRADSYEARLRYLYLPGGDEARQGRSRGGIAGAGGGGPSAARRVTDPNMTLDYAFKTQLFWIVSRSNNCQYCLGHQESKLLGAGLFEDEIAALDGDWSRFTPAEQAAFAFTRKITYEPHMLSDQDIVSLHSHYTDLQILEIILSVASNNSINRWKEGTGIPQSANGGGFGRRSRQGEIVDATSDQPLPPSSYMTPTGERYQRMVTKVAPLLVETKPGDLTCETIFSRPALEPRAEVEAILQAGRERAPRLPLVEEATTRKVLGWPDADSTDARVPQWMRLLAHFPETGSGLVSRIDQGEELGDLAPLLKAQVSWIVARLDRAWYAAGLARGRLQQLGEPLDRIYQLDGDWREFTAAERALFDVARKLAATPIVLTDQEVRHAVELVGPRDVVQLINYVTSRAMFNRITEAAGLQVEP